MINIRLTWLLELRNLLSNLQTGFKVKRSSIDQIVHIDTLIQEAFITTEQDVAVFFELENAYGTSWPTKQTPYFCETLFRRPNFLSTNNTFFNSKPKK